MEVTTRWYEEHAYKMNHVHKQNLGWDLEARLKSEKALLLEVKGLSGSEITIELTPNEYAQMQNHKEDYRICVVLSADNYKTRTLYRFRYSAERNEWIDQNGRQLRVTKMTGARATTG